MHKDNDVDDHSKRSCGVSTRFLTKRLRFRLYNDARDPTDIRVSETMYFSLPLFVFVKSTHFKQSSNEVRLAKNITPVKYIQFPLNNNITS